MTYKSRINSLLFPQERRVFQKLSSPESVQTYLDHFPVNFEISGETNFSPRRVLEEKTAHCFEGAVFAAAVLAFHGHTPLLMDFATDFDDEDHTVALFKRGKFWGAISKTNHSVLRYRDAIYKSPRELAMSYFHEYFMWDGRKSMRAFSSPFNLTRFAPETWITSRDSLDWLMTALSKSRYNEVVSARQVRSLRKASKIELDTLKITEWKKRTL